MAKQFTITNIIDKTTAAHMLGGLAVQYRTIPASAPRSVSANIRMLIINILGQLEEQGEDLFKAHSPFKSYVGLVSYKKFKENLINY